MLCYSVSCPQAIQLVWWVIQLWGLGRVLPDPSAISTWQGRGLPDFVPPNDISTPNLWWVLNLTILVWWLDIRLIKLRVQGWWSFFLLNHTFTLGSWAMSTLTLFPFEPSCEDYSFLDQAVADFEHGLESIFNDSVKTPKIDRLTSLMPWCLQCLQHLYTWLVPFLIILNC